MTRRRLVLGVATAAAAIGCGGSRPLAGTEAGSPASNAGDAADARDGADAPGAADAPDAADIHGASDVAGDFASDAADAAESGSGGVVAFDVVAQLTPGGDGGAVDVPSSRAVTIAIDRSRAWAVVGAGGLASVFSLLDQQGKLSAYGTNVALTSGFTSTVELLYQSLDLTLLGAGLAGTGHGLATTSPSCLRDHGFSAVLTGTTDVTPPTLATNAVFLTDPFASWSVATSEPLPLLGNAGAKSRLVGDSGPSFDLEPEVGVSNLVPRVLVGFAKPAVVLKPGAEYTVTAEGLVDFAGNAGTPPAPRRVAAIAPAPLVPEDGFEQATGPSLGGASVVTANAITGTKSLYFGFSGAPSLGGVAPGGSLLVRLALQPSDRVVRFSYRIVGFDKEAAGPATFATIGSVGGQIVSQSIPYGGLYPLGDVYLGPVELLVVPLPADAAGEIVVGLATQFTCGSVAHPGAMLVDELRAEPQP